MRKGSVSRVVFTGDGRVTVSDVTDEAPALLRGLGVGPRAGRRRLGRRLELFRRRSCLMANALSTTPTPDLWRVHRDGMAGVDAAGGVHLFAVKVELARRALSPCVLCEHRCLARRLEGERGLCGSDGVTRVTHSFITRGEETRVTGGAMFFLAGCNWSCPFCQYPAGLNPRAGEELTAAWFNERVRHFEDLGATNLHFVGGNPDQHIAAILEALQATPCPLEVVWNSNGFASTEAMALLDGVVDVYLTDLRYGNDRCAVELGAAEGTWNTVTRNILLSLCQRAEVIIRHLQLPGHFECCTRPCLEWMAGHASETSLNLMGGQYVPTHSARNKGGLSRPLEREEHRQAVRLSRRLGLRLVEANDV